MQWLREWLDGFKGWLIEVLLYIPRKVFDLFLKAIASVMEAMPAPDFIVNYSLGDLISGDILWMLHSSGVSVALTIVSSAVVFRILRRLVTLGIW